MLDTSARLLRLLVVLSSAGHRSGRELAERLEVTERTLRRDIDRLRSLGYVVRSSAGVGGGYRLDAGSWLPPLVFEDDEALAVALALRTVAAGNVTGVESAALRALTKLERVLPQRVRDRIKPLLASVQSLHVSGPRADPDTLLALAVAHQNSRRVSFQYRDRAGRCTTRSVEPHGLIYKGTRWYLAAWDDDRRDWRTFRVDRMDKGISAGAAFDDRPEPDGGIAAFVSRSVDPPSSPLRANVVIFAPLDRVVEQLPSFAPHLSPLDTGRCRLQTSGAPSLERLAMNIMLLGEEFRIEGPPELQDFVRELGARLGRATEGTA